MDVLRTPDERFLDLQGYPYAPNYIEVEDGLRMHYVAVGPHDGFPILLLHGEPSWSYLYRTMIPILAEARMRVIAPDLIGFGRSDKPARREDYTYARHIAWIEKLVVSLDLHRATLVGQDWGGLIGLRLLPEHGDRFDRVVAANTFLPTGREPVPEAFFKWRTYSQEVEDFDIADLIDRSTTTTLSDDVLYAYEAPFPDESYKAGARQFPMLVPVSTDDPESAKNIEAWKTLTSWNKPFLTAFSDGDPITRGGDVFLQQAIPGCAGVEHTTITGGGHFLQEDRGPELARAILRFVAATVTEAAKAG